MFAASGKDDGTLEQLPNILTLNQISVAVSVRLVTVTPQPGLGDRELLSMRVSNSG